MTRPLETMTDADLIAYAEHHESLADDARTILQERKHRRNALALEESLPFVDEAIAALTAKGYTFDEVPAMPISDPGYDPSFMQYVLTGLPFSGGQGLRPSWIVRYCEKQEALANLCMSGLRVTSLKAWHDQRQ